MIFCPTLVSLVSWTHSQWSLELMRFVSRLAGVTHQFLPCDSHFFALSPSPDFSSPCLPSPSGLAICSGLDFLDAEIFFFQAGLWQMLTFLLPAAPAPQLPPCQKRRIKGSIRKEAAKFTPAPCSSLSEATLFRATSHSAGSSVKCRD